jgi:hypothetical protein
MLRTNLRLFAVPARRSMPGFAPECRGIRCDWIARACRRFDRARNKGVDRKETRGLCAGRSVFFSTKRKAFRNRRNSL